MNERKTYIVNRDKYIEHMERERQYFTDAWREKRDELTTVDFYSFEPITPEDPEVFAAVAMEELQAWAAAAKSVSGAPLSTTVQPAASAGASLASANWFG